MSIIASVLMNVGLSIAASGIWAFIGLFLYRKEKISRKNFAFFQLFSGLDRLKDVLNEIIEMLKMPSKDKDKFYESIKQNETKLERYVAAVNYNWTVANIPYKSEKGEIIWMYDLGYILGNCREMVNELYSFSCVVKERDMCKDANQHIANQHIANQHIANQHIKSMSDIAKDMLSAIEEEIKLIPDKHKNIDMNK